MTIDKADILTALNARLNRKETGIDTYIESALEEITLDFNTLKKSSTFVIVAGDYEFTIADGDIPEQFKDLEAIRLYNPRTEKYSKPLGRFNSWNDYLLAKANETSANRSEPTDHIIRNKKVYTWPESDNSYTAYLDYFAWEEDADDIQIQDEYEECLVCATCFKYLEGKGQGTSKNGILYKGLYEDWQTKLAGLDVNREGPKTIVNNDI